MCSASQPSSRAITEAIARKPKGHDFVIDRRTSRVRPIRASSVGDPASAGIGMVVAGVALLSGVIFARTTRPVSGVLYDLQRAHHD